MNPEGAAGRRALIPLRSPRTAKACSSLQGCWLLPCQPLGEHSQGCPLQHPTRICPQTVGLRRFQGGKVDFGSLEENIKAVFEVK